jgi:hypothetical protein
VALDFILFNLGSGYAISSSTTIIAPIFVELVHNSGLFLHKLASINAIIAALDTFNALVN